MTPSADLGELFARLAVAGLGGLAVGIEREWSASPAGGEAVARFAGVRTFFLLGLAGGLAAILHGAGAVAPSAVLLATAALVVLAAYAIRASRGSVDSTTEVAALVVLGAAFVAGTGRLALASGAFAVVALALVEKGRLHAAVSRLRSEEISAGARFGVLALVVLPLLPEGPLGRTGIRPRELWTLVLLFSAVSFGGFVSMRAFGARRGYGFAGLLGGVVSSTAVTLQFARESRRRPEIGPDLAVGVLAACTVLPVRVAAVSSFLDPAFAVGLLPLLAPPFVVGAALGATAFRQADRTAESAALPANPLRLGSALLLAAGFALVTWALGALSSLVSEAGLLWSGAAMGLTDVDVLTYSLAKLAADPAFRGPAARALAMGIVANTALKLAVALVVGRGSFRRRAGAGLGALLGASLAALALA